MFLFGLFCIMAIPPWGMFFKERGIAVQIIGVVGLIAMLVVSKLQAN